MLVSQVIGQTHVAYVTVVELVAAAHPADAASVAVVLLLVHVIIQTANGAKILTHRQTNTAVRNNVATGYL